MARVTNPGGGRKRASTAKAAAATPPAAPATPPTAQAPTPAPEPQAHKRAGIEVVGPALGRRRAGRAFGTESTRIPLDELTEAEIAAIDGDPALTATRINID